ncbi:hypothetical protein [Chryseobacterium sp. Mn2064]|uniref:hypothetical protein n=1 Tax=Chryseobacterium sp. Mn2064 TaxID=3395263 RepID=UPI003BEE8F5C
MKAIIPGLLLFWISVVFGQESKTDTIYNSERIVNSTFDTLNYPIKKYHQLLSMHDPILYLGVAPYFANTKERLSPLEDKEGKNGYWLEGNMNFRFAFYKGAYYSPKWIQRLRVTFDAGFIVRMTQDSSSPLLPTNNEFGIGADYFLSKFDFSGQKWHSWFTFQAHHYSNGQSDNPFRDASNLRNNYKNGDFSTNYLRGIVYFAKPIWTYGIASAGLGYQRDMTFFNPLTITEEMKHGSYGQNRLLLNLQLLRRSTFVITENSDIKPKFTTINKRQKFAFRSEMSYIIDGDLRPLAPTNKKYRFAAHNYIIWYPWEKADIGFIIKHYYGRDYLNIRYDDVIHGIQAGITIDVNKKN